MSKNSTPNNLNFLQHALKDLKMGSLYEQFGENYSTNVELAEYLDFCSDKIKSQKTEVNEERSNLIRSGIPIILDIHLNITINEAPNPTDKNSSSITALLQEKEEEYEPVLFSSNNDDNTLNNQDPLQNLNDTSSLSESHNNVIDAFEVGNPQLASDYKTNYSDKAIYAITATFATVLLGLYCFFRCKLSPSKKNVQSEIPILGKEPTNDSLNSSIPTNGISAPLQVESNDNDNKSVVTQTTTELRDDVSDITQPSDLGDPEISNDVTSSQTNKSSIQDLAGLICSHFNHNSNQNQLRTLINAYINNNAQFNFILEQADQDKAMSSDKFLSQYIGEQLPHDLLQSLYQDICKAKQSALVMKFIDIFNEKELDFTTNDKIIYKAPIKYDLNDVIQYILRGNEDTVTHWQHILPLALKYSKSEIIQLYADSTCPALEGRYDKNGSLNPSQPFTILNLCLSFAIFDIESLNKNPNMNQNKLDLVNKDIKNLLMQLTSLIENKKISFFIDSSDICSKTYHCIKSIKKYEPNNTNLDISNKQTLATCVYLLKSKFLGLIDSMPGATIPYSIPYYVSKIAQFAEDGQDSLATTSLAESNIDKLSHQTSHQNHGLDEIV